MLVDENAFQNLPRSAFYSMLNIKHICLYWRDQVQLDKWWKNLLDFELFNIPKNPYVQ